MDFTLSDEQQAVRDLAGQILGDLTTGARLAALGDDWLDRHAWEQLAQAGLLGVALPAENGGSDLGFFGAHLILEQVGAHAAPLPAWETLVLGALPIATFGTAAQQARWLPGVVDGATLLTAAVGTWPDDPAPVQALQTAAGWELTGTAASVPIGAIADAVLVPAATGTAGPGVWIVPAGTDGMTARRQLVISGAPYAEIDLDRVAVGPDALLGPPDGSVVEWLALHAPAGLASLTSGLCGAAVRMAADYTSRREQFGRPIATFQAVAQRVADAFIDAEAVQLTALEAAWRLTEGLPAAEQVAIAKWWAAEAGHRVLHSAHHVHGGVGVDREYPLHRFFAMAKQHEFLLGGATPQLLRIGELMATEPV